MKKTESEKMIKVKIKKKVKKTDCKTNKGKNKESEGTLKWNNRSKH